MAKFSAGRDEDDSEGPSSPRPKKQRTLCSQPPRQQEQQHQTLEQIPGQCEVESECDEGEEQEDEGESEHEEEEFEVDGDREESDRTEIESLLNGDCITLMDPDVLDCPICFEPLSAPVFQCENGHVACPSCCTKIENKCPSCAWPIGYNRCRAIEKVIESAKISCINTRYGCHETVSYNKKHEHENTCMYAPCSCPLSACNFIGSSKELFTHFSTKHSNSAKRFQYDSLVAVDLCEEQRYLFLQEQTDGTIFILNNVVEILGNMVNVVCISPRSTKKGYAYDLIARKEDISVRLQSFTEGIPRWDERFPLNRFLLVSFLFGSGKLKLELCIRRHQEDPAPILRGKLCCSRS